MKTYLEQHPNATLREYVDYLAAQQREISNIRKMELENKKAYLENCIGKYFKVVFNSSASMYFKVTTNLNKKDSNVDFAYEVYSDNLINRITVAKNRYVNCHWLLGEYCDKVSEISEEEYNKIVEFGNSLINTINQLNKL